MPTQKPAILIADDTSANIEIVYGILGSSYDVLVASNGREAVDLAVAERPDLILLDVMMPEVDGYEACRLLKANPLTSEIPVIFLTGMADVDSIVKGFDAGGVDYIGKPFQPKELLARVRTHLALMSALNDERALRIELEAALKEVKQLSGLLPICSNCKKIRDDQGGWDNIETYISTRSEAQFTHGICPDCARRLYGLDLEGLIKSNPPPAS